MSPLSFTWWFGTIPLYETTTLRIYFAGFLSLMIVGAVVRMVSRRRLQDRFHMEVARRVATLCVIMGFLGVWYWFAAYQQLPFLSARFWVPVWAMGAVIWVLTILRYAFKVVPRERERLHQNAEDEKYFQPKHKK